MLIAYLNKAYLEPHVITEANQQLIKEAVWLDLLSPTRLEEIQVETELQLDIPTRAEMAEIELSSRLYRENGTLFMTANMIAQSNAPNPFLDPVTFVLSSQQLISIRYIEPQAFKLVLNKLQQLKPEERTALTVLIELLDSTVDRLADTLELVGRRLDDYSNHLFQPAEHTNIKLDYRELLQKIGADADLNTKARDSLVTFNRMTSFITQTEHVKLDQQGKMHIITIEKDIISLSDHMNFLSAKISFLLDATLGMVGIEQNNIIKIFSIAAVIFLPPTLVASIYGMNFHVMPELSWKYGYLLAIGLILIAAWLPYKYFKYKKWL